MDTERKPRPIRISLFAIAICLFSAWYGIRLVEAIRFWRILSDYHMHPGPAYLAVSGGFWLAVGLILIAGLWSGRAWGWVGSLAGSAGYVIWYWFDRLVLQAPHSNWPFALAWTAIVLAVVLVILLTPKSIRFFHQREDHEHEPEG